MNRVLKKQGFNALEKVYDKKKGGVGIKTGDPSAKSADGTPAAPADGAHHAPPPPPPVDAGQPPPPPPADGVAPQVPAGEGAPAGTAPDAPEGAADAEGKKKKGGILGKVQAKLKDPAVQKKIEGGAKTALKRKATGRRRHY